jgi:hypothetical protein
MESPHSVVASPLLQLIMSPCVHKDTYPHAGFYPTSQRHGSLLPQNSGGSQQPTGSLGVLSPSLQSVDLFPTQDVVDPIQSDLN